MERTDTLRPGHISERKVVGARDRRKTGGQMRRNLLLSLD